MRSFMNGLLKTPAELGTSDITTAIANIKTVANTVLGILGVAVTFLAVYLAFKFFTADSDEKRKDAKGQLIYAIIGMIVIIAIIVLWNTVFSSLLSAS
jgi:ABC-type antimicrobial peptide transport system permease subunit